MDIKPNSTNPGLYNYNKIGYGSAVRCLTSNSWAVHYDANTEILSSGEMPNQSFAEGANGALNSNAFQRPFTDTRGYRFTGWNTKPDGSGTAYADRAEVPAQPVGTSLTLYAQWEEVDLLVVDYDSNGLEFSNGAITNTIAYYNNCINKYRVSKYSHTPNISDDGTQNGNYSNNYTKNEVVTIPGASKLHIVLTYGGESASFDWVSLWAGNYPSYTAASDYSSGVKLGNNTTGKYGGGSHTATSNTVEGDIDGDTVTFAFKSDGSSVGDGYGYYVIVMADFETEPEYEDSQLVAVCNRIVVNGKYKEPSTGDIRTFYGWSENPNATSVTYDNHDSVMTSLPGSGGETKTIYAFYKNHIIINYNANGGAGTTESQHIVAGESIRLKSNNFSAPAKKAFDKWCTNADGTGDCYSGGSIYSAPSTVNYEDTITFYAIWKNSLTITYHGNGATSGADPQTQEIPSGTSANLKSANTFSKDAYSLTKWCTNASGSGDCYNPGESFSAPTDITYEANVDLYAQWTIHLTIYYYGNGQTSGDNPQLQTIPAGTSATLKDSSAYAKTGFRLVSWNTEADGNGNTYATSSSYVADSNIEVGAFINLYAIWEPTYSIVYDINTSDENADGDMSSAVHKNIYEGDTVTLYAPNYSRRDYGFAGWSFNPAASVNNGDVIYGPNGTITAPAYSAYGSNNTITLYAIWTPIIKDSNNNELTFQTPNLNTITLADGTTLESKSIGYVTALRDNRDNSVYSVAKLADGNWWMIENLRLNIAGRSIDAANTNNPTESFINDVANMSNPTFNDCKSSDSDCINQISIGLGNILGDSSSYNSQTQASRWHGYGIMYNWYTATAGNGKYETGPTNVAGDICPAGWHMPTNRTSSGEFRNLYTAINNAQTGSNGSERMRAFPNNFVYNGYYTGSSTSGRSTYAEYWASSGMSSNDDAEGFSFSSNGVWAGGNGGRKKYYGYAVRCLTNGSSISQNAP